MSPYDPERFAADVKKHTDEIAAMLIDKNKRYGDSALNPVRVFSKANPVEQLLVRIDDKLSRISRGKAEDDEDPIDDLLGYLVLLKIAKIREGDNLAVAGYEYNKKLDPKAMAIGNFNSTIGCDQDK